MMPYPKHRKSRTPYGILCHLEKPRFGYGMCRSCYRKWKYRTDPAYREKVNASAKRTRIKHIDRVRAYKIRYREEHKNDQEYLEKNRKRAREYYQEHKDQPEFREKNRVRGRIYARNRRVLQGDELRRKDREWKRKNPDKVFDMQLRCDYGISLEQYRQMIFDQKGKCKLCGNPPSKRGFRVDHNHVTKQVRGLICERCNIRLGIYEKTEWVKKALAYLANPPMNKVIAMRKEKQTQ